MTKPMPKAFILAFSIVSIAVLAFGIFLVASDTSYADIYVGDEKISNTWEPSEMIHTDSMPEGLDEVTAKNAPAKLMDVLAKLIRLLMPIVIIACVVILILNAGRNLFVKPEERIKMGEMLKNIVINFFWIFAAPIVVELIVYVVTNGETILFSTLLN